MTLRTATYDTETHKICPIEADEIQIQQGCLSQTIGKFANYEEWWNSHSSGVSERIRDLIAKDYRAMIAAAPEYQEPENPLDTPLPCDIRIGAGTIKKGCKLSVLVHRMNVLYQMAMKTQLGISVAVLPDLESRDFYEVMQAYRTAILDAAPQFEAVKQWLRNPTCEYQEPTKNE